jgi:hypothetical protein
MVRRFRCYRQLKNHCNLATDRVKPADRVLLACLDDEGILTIKAAWWQAVPHVRRPGREERRVASPFLFAATLTLAVVSCFVLWTADTRVEVADTESGASQSGASQQSDFQDSPGRQSGSSGMSQVKGSQRLYHFHSTSPEFMYDHARHEDKAKINTGYMTCCKRRGHDIEAPLFTGYYSDWPKEPLCIPGYHLLGEHLEPPVLIDPPNLNNPGHCVVCDAGTYCPEVDDHIFKCPPPLMSLQGAAEETDCWCAPGYRGGPDANMQKFSEAHRKGLEAGLAHDIMHEDPGDCKMCDVDRFCPSEIPPKACPEELRSGDACERFFFFLSSRFPLSFSPPSLPSSLSSLLLPSLFPSHNLIFLSPALLS